MNRCCESLTVLREKGRHIGEYCTSCGKWLRWVPQQVTLERAKSFVMPFGVHKGKPLGELDDETLDWYWEHLDGKNAKIGEMARLVYESR
jgi:uncharacterized protein (DUF3820 family)